MEKINFILPGLTEHFKLNSFFIELQEKEPNKFYDNVKIHSIYGNFQFCIWDGGRVFKNYNPHNLEDIYYISNYLKSKNISLRLIFTNPLISKEEELNDHFCNLVTQICEDKNNEIVVNSPILEEYLRQNYSQYSFISSTTKCNSFKQTKEDLKKDYKMICLDYNLNNNFTLLDSLSEEEKNKCELLCNAICPPGCPNRKEHYKLNGLYHLNLCKKYSIDCGIKFNTLNSKTINYNHHIDINKIINIYSQKGFKYFKLEGRTLSNEENLLNYVSYMIKPEYYFDVINTALQNIYKE